MLSQSEWGNQMPTVIFRRMTKSPKGGVTSSHEKTECNRICGSSSCLKIRKSEDRPCEPPGSQIVTCISGRFKTPCGHDVAKPERNQFLQMEMNL